MEILKKRIAKVRNIEKILCTSKQRNIIDIIKQLKSKQRVEI